MQIKLLILRTKVIIYFILFLTYKNNYVYNIKNYFYIFIDIASYLKLPPVKLHCSMLAEDAIKKAVADYKTK